MFKLIVKPLVEVDITEAAVWYNFQREGLGEEFLLAMEAKFKEIQGNPFQFRIIYKNIRRAFPNRFPYGIFYVADDNIIYILAIVHSSRNQKIWKKRK